ncbi:hypothetical protein DORFOR_02823 [Dorea formicigenerans ATCC 27755]|uniref:Uncharacterized protein n=1 Tax=Dorea formicigenerans ATCC 27755 TaxID=411461 RepID=B0G961_9FIRM|nr:hypothetical protein DORFOR_02823 [Dorea formicigenerans ATCC 27755]
MGYFGTLICRRSNNTFYTGYWERQLDKSMEECGELLEKNKLRRKKNEM